MLLGPRRLMDKPPGFYPGFGGSNPPESAILRGCSLMGKRRSVEAKDASSNLVNPAITNKGTDERCCVDCGHDIYWHLFDLCTATIESGNCDCKKFVILA